MKTSILAIVLLAIGCSLSCVGWLITGRVWQRTSCGRDPTGDSDRRADSCSGGCHLCGGSDPEMK